MSGFLPSSLTLQGQTAYYFGTFDPVHTGHLVVAQVAIAAFGLAQVVFVPTGQPPHRQTHRTPLASAAHRLAMAQAATQHHPALSVSDLETHGEGPHYTADTLRQLVGGGEAVWHGIHQPTIPVIIGEDTLPTLHTWHQAPALLEKVCFLVAPRFTSNPFPPLNRSNATGGLSPMEAGGRLIASGVWIPSPPWALSASWVRAVVAQGGDASPWLPSAVWAHLQTHGLYGSPLTDV